MHLQCGTGPRGHRSDAELEPAYTGLGGGLVLRGEVLRVGPAQRLVRTHCEPFFCCGAPGAAPQATLFQVFGQIGGKGGCPGESAGRRTDAEPTRNKEDPPYAQQFS